MKHFIKMMFVFFVVSSILYSQEYLARNLDNGTNEGKIYTIGTGLSFSFGNDFSLIVDSYHFFNISPNNKVFLKFGMGAYTGIIPKTTTNFISGNPIIVPDFPSDPFDLLGTGFTVSTSLGYMYVLHGWKPGDEAGKDHYNNGPCRLNLSGLDELGFGISFDYNYANLDKKNYHTLGLTFYLKLNQFLIGLGAGASLNPSDLGLALTYKNNIILGLPILPYGKVSFGFLF